MQGEPAYRADGQACTESVFYALACDPARSAIVEACAGAGKTWLLVSRIVRALLDGARPEEILAITFTRKAAAEMRLRLHDWLREFATASDEQRATELQRRGLNVLQAEIQAPALAALQARVLAAGQEVQVHTFHAWFAQLLRVAPLEVLDALGVHPSMALIEEVDDQLGELMRRFQRQVLDTPALLDDYRALIERHGRRDLERWLRAAIDKRLEIERADARAHLESTVPSAQQQWPECAAYGHPVERMVADRSLRRLFGDAVDGLGRHNGKLERDAGTALAGALDLADPRAALKQARKALFTDKGPPRKLDASPALDAAVNAVLRLELQVAQQDAHDDHRCMVRLSRALLECWRVLKRERALIDMQDLERCALVMLSDPAIAGWVQQRLDARLRHVLIDEFQDTSNLQWQALLGWLSSYAGAGGGASGRRPLAVFIVGDPKQSIYRFRGAEPRVFDEARRFVVEGLEGHDLACNHTRRNATAVVSAVNAVFNQAVNAGEFDGFIAHSTARADDAPGHVWHAAEPAGGAREAAQRRSDWRDSLTEPRHQAKEARAQDEARRIAAGVRQLLDQGVAAGDVIVLARRRVTLAWVAQALHALHVPCVAAEELRLADVIEVKDLVALLDVLVSHGNDLALAQALKSPLFGASDAELLALSQRADRRCATVWWSALMAWHDAPPALQRARTLLASWSDAARRLPPHDLLDRVVHQGDLMARLAAAVPADRRVAALAAVNALIALSLSLEGGRHASVYRFVRTLRQRALGVKAPARSDAVQLMTIHAVKGLEARCVWVADADPAENHGSEPGVLVDWPVDHDAPRRAAFVADLRSPCASLVDLQARERAATQREELNALYVAMTRAREMLFLSRTPPRRGVGLTWWARVTPHSVALEPNESGRGVASAADERITIRQLPEPVSARVASASAAPTAPPSYAARLGRAVHRVLQWASAGEPDLAGLARAAVIEFELPPSAAAAAEGYARTIRGSPALQRFFDPRQVAWSADEFDLVHQGDWLRVDRLVRFGPADDAHWWVLDYKLALDAAADTDLRGQLERYRAAVRLLAGGSPVHAAFITGDGALHELPARADG
ncbi:MAG: UvrD-helicase domain-containing protein [Burkholderiaceae bacterium]|nr:UvrD-helicase domain-containing protein [Burkholderiaceae bacterium]